MNVRRKAHAETDGVARDLFANQTAVMPRMAEAHLVAAGQLGHSSGGCVSCSDWLTAPGPKVER